MTVESELYEHLDDNLSGPTIGWVAENVNFRPIVGTNYILPMIESIISRALEVPHDSSIVASDYRFGLNLLVPYDTGTATSRTYIASLKTLYHKKDIATTNFRYYFDTIESRKGFLSPTSSEHFEIPVFTDFRVYVT